MLPLSEKELDELVALERARGEPPLTNWDSIASELRSQGLIKKRFGGLSTRLMQIAAALALVAGGAAFGRYTARSNSSAVAVSSTAPASSIASNTTAQNVSTGSAATSPGFKSADEAWTVLNRAGEEYQRASAFLSASNNEIPLPSSTDTYRTRLTALDEAMTSMRTALHEAPHDPVINQYYMATVGAREATLRQLGTTLPAGRSLNRF